MFIEVNYFNKPLPSIILINFRTWNNYSIVTFGKDYEYWGACKPECRGEMPSAESEYNLAKDTEIFNSVWTDGLYDLQQYEAGFCFTYDPPQKSESGLSSGLYFMLGHNHLSVDYKNISKHVARDSSFLLFSFDIYLHEKDQFWPRQGPSDHGDKVPSGIIFMHGKLKTKNLDP